jgi:hypothetical protein
MGLGTRVAHPPDAAADGGAVASLVREEWTANPASEQQLATLLVSTKTTEDGGPTIRIPAAAYRCTLSRRWRLYRAVGVHAAISAHSQPCTPRPLQRRGVAGARRGEAGWLIAGTRHTPSHLPQQTAHRTVSKPSAISLPVVKGLMYSIGSAATQDADPSIGVTPRVF